MLPLDETPYEFEVTSELTGKGIGLYITVTSAHAKEVNVLLKSRMMLKHRTSELISLYLDNDSLNVVDDQELEILSATARVVGWRGIIEPFTRDNVLILCSTNPFIRQQIINVSNDISMKFEELIATLIEYAKNELVLSEKQKDGSPLRDHLLKLKTAHGINDPLLTPIKVSPAVTYLWEYFLDLNNTRQSGMGVSAINYTEIKSWCDLTGNTLSAFEVRVIKMLDSVFLAHYNKQSEKETSKDKD
jgi:hypothetical protein